MYVLLSLVGEREQDLCFNCTERLQVCFLLYTYSCQSCLLFYCFIIHYVNLENV